MKIPWNWLKEKIISPKDFTIENFLENLNYFGLECEESFENNKTYVNFFVPQNRRDMRSWIGLTKEISTILNFEVKENENFFNLNSKKYDNQFNFAVDNFTKNKKKSSFFVLKNLKNKKKTPELLKEYLSKNNLLISGNLFSNLLTLANLKTGYKNKSWSVACSCKKDEKEHEKTSVHDSTEVFLLEIIDNKNSDFVSTIEESKFLEIFLEDLKEFFEEVKVEIVFLSKNYSKAKKESSIFVGKKFLENKIGTSFSNEEISNSLKKLKFRFFLKKIMFSITIPFYREDIKIKEDLLEELGRTIDYNKISNENLTKKLERDSFEKNNFYWNTLKMKASTFLVSIGFQEVITYSLIDEKKIVGDKNDYFEVINPRSLNHVFYRKFVFPSHIELFKTGVGKGFDEVSFFEISKTYSKTELDKEKISLFVSEKLSSKHSEEFKLSHFRNLIEKIFQMLSIDLEKNYLEYVTEKSNVFEKRFRLDLNKNKIGFIAANIDKKHFKIEEKFKRCFVCEIDLDFLKEILSSKKEIKTYESFSHSPLIKKDVAFFTSKRNNIQNIFSLIRKNFEDVYLYNLNLVDVYDKSPDDLNGDYSLCFHIEFVGRENNLDNQEINLKIDKLMISLNNAFGIIRR